MPQNERLQRMKHKRVERIIAVLCAVSLLLALGACSSSDDKPYASYNMDKLIKPGEYKGVEAAFETMSDETLQAYMEEVFAYYQMGPGGVKDDPSKEAVAAGDLVFFDYEGTAEGATAEDLEGMKGNIALVIGSGQFIPGFEDQLIGQPRDKEFDVNVTFPDPYQSETLAGKPAVFKCTVHQIGSEAEFSDEDVAYLTGGEITTLAAFMEVLEPEAEASLVQKNTNAAFEAAFKNAEILKIPAKEQKYWDKQLAAQAETQGMSIEEFLTAIGFEGNLEDYKKQERDETIKREMFAYAVAKKEDISVTDEEVAAWIEGYRAQGTSGTDEEIYERIGGKGALLRWLLQNKVSEFIYDNAKDAPPRPDSPDHDHSDPNHTH